MSRFSKAAPQQAKLKAAAYGLAGSGKTFTTLLMAEGLAKAEGKRIAYIDTERGTDFYAMDVPQRQLHPEAWDFDAIYTRSLAEMTEETARLDPKVHGVVVVDSMTHVWDAAIEAYSGKKTRIDSIPMHAWGKIKKPYKDFVKFLMGSPFHVFILGRQKNLFENDEESEGMKKVGVAMKAEGETAYEPHICWRMELWPSPHGEGRSDNVMIVEKDRTGVLAGRTIRNPSFATLVPLLPLLGAVQAPPEDEEERIARDADKFSGQAESRDAQKEERSIETFHALQALIFQATGLEQLNSAANEIKKQKRHLLEPHEAALREMYKSKRDKIVSAATPEM